MRTGAMSDRAVREAERAGGGSAGQSMKRGQRGEIRHEGGSKESERGERKSGERREARVQTAEARGEEEAAQHRSEQEQRHQAACALRLESVFGDQRSHPHRKRNQIDHSGAVGHHQRDAPWPFIRACLHDVPPPVRKLRRDGEASSLSDERLTTLFAIWKIDCFYANDPCCG